MKKKAAASKMNTKWHTAHPMPANATLDQRVTWHRAHAAKCGCRTMPASIAAELERCAQRKR